MKKILMFVTALAATGFVRAAIQPIEGTNVVGFAAVTASGGENTIITIPFEACLGGGDAGMLSDLVATNGLTASSDAGSADQLVVLTTEGATQVYYYYYFKPVDGWTPITSAMLMPDGSSQAIEPPAADSFAISRGLGFWIKRVASASSTLYMKGQVSDAKQATQIEEGLNLIGYGAVTDFALNSAGISWTGANGGTGNTSTSDKIIVANGDGSFTEYYYFIKPAEWGPEYNDLDHKWITKSYTVVPVTTMIEAGQGFWYLRRAGQGSFTFRPDGE